MPAVCLTQGKYSFNRVWPGSCQAQGCHSPALALGSFLGLSEPPSALEDLFWVSKTLPSSRSLGVYLMSPSLSMKQRPKGAEMLFAMFNLEGHVYELQTSVPKGTSCYHD